MLSNADRIKTSKAKIRRATWERGRPVSPQPPRVFAFSSTERPWSLELAIGNYPFEAKNMRSSERNFAPLGPGGTSVFSKRRNILIQIVYLLLTALVSQNAR